MSALGSPELQCDTQATRTRVSETPDGPGAGVRLLLSTMEAEGAGDTGTHAAPSQTFL